MPRLAEFPIAAFRSNFFFISILPIFFLLLGLPEDLASISNNLALSHCLLFVKKFLYPKKSRAAATPGNPAIPNFFGPVAFRPSIARGLAFSAYCFVMRCVL